MSYEKKIVVNGRICFRRSARRLGPVKRWPLQSMQEWSIPKLAVNAELFHCNSGAFLVVEAVAFPMLLSSCQISHDSSKCPSDTQRDQQPPQVVTLPNSLVVLLRNQWHLGLRLPLENLVVSVSSPRQNVDSSEKAQGICSWDRSHGPQWGQN